MSTDVVTAEVKRDRRAELARRLTGARWLDGAVIAAALAFYATFIARVAFRFEGRTYFGLHDDAMISMRFARNLASGDGLTWSGGERVEGYTNFLWTLWMALLHLLPDRDVVAPLAVTITGAALLVAGMLAVRAICRVLAPDSPLLGTVAMALTGAFYPLAFWTLRGMEVGLAALLIAVMVLLALRLERRPGGRDAWLLAAAMATAVLTRDDLVLPCAVVGAYAVWTAEPAARRRIAAIVGGAVLIPVAAHVAFRLAYYDAALPNTYHLKLGGIPLADRLERGGIALAYTWLFTLYAPLLLAGAYLAARRPLQRGALLLAAVVIVQSAYSVYVGGDAWEDLRIANRYVTSTAPLFLTLATLGIGELSQPRARRLLPWLAAALAAMAAVVSYEWLPVEHLRIFPEDGPRPASIVALGGAALVLVLWRARTVGAVLVVALAAVALVQVDGRPLRSWVRSNAIGTNLDEYWARSGLIIREETSPQTTVAVVGAGNTPYFSHRPSIDLLGKNDTFVARSRPKFSGLPGWRTTGFWPGHNKWDFDHSIGGLRPDLVTLHWTATPAELCRIRGWGYRQIAQQVFVREGARGVRPEIGPRIAALMPFLPHRVPARCPP